MSEFIGANPEQLREFASNSDRAATSLREMAEVMRGWPVAAWKGPDAKQFESIVDTGLIAPLRSVADALESMANDVRRNAQEQEATSATLDGGVGGNGGPGYHAPGADLGSIINSAVFQSNDLLGVLDAKGLLQMGASTKFASNLLGVLGIGADGRDVALAIQDGDVSQALTSLLRVGAGAVGQANPVAGFVAGVGMDVFGMYVPTSAQAQDELVAYASTQLGPGETLTDRYDGSIKGFGNMVFDQVNYSANNPTNPISAFIGWAGNGIGDLISPPKN